MSLLHKMLIFVITTLKYCTTQGHRKWPMLRAVDALHRNMSLLISRGKLLIGPKLDLLTRQHPDAIIPRAPQSFRAHRCGLPRQHLLVLLIPDPGTFKWNLRVDTHLSNYLRMAQKPHRDVLLERPGKMLMPFSAACLALLVFALNLAQNSMFYQGKHRMSLVWSTVIHRMHDRYHLVVLSDSEHH